MTLSDFQRLIAPLHRRVVNMVARAIVKTVSDDKKMQLLQVNILDGETKDEVERFQNYGFTSFPEDDAEALVACIGGKRDHTVVIAVDDRRYRIGNLSKGEVLVYDKTGSKVLLKSNGDIELTPSSGTLKVVGDLTVSGDLSCDGDASVSGDTSCDGTVTGSTDVVGGGISLKNHKHSLAVPATVSISTSNAVVGSPSTASSATGVSGDTAGPS